MLYHVAGNQKRGNVVRTQRSIATVLVALMCAWAAPSSAQDVVKIGMVVPMTGPFTPTGKQLVAGAKLYMQHQG